MISKFILSTKLVESESHFKKTQNLFFDNGTSSEDGDSTILLKYDMSFYSCYAPLRNCYRFATGLYIILFYTSYAKDSLEPMQLGKVTKMLATLPIWMAKLNF